MLEGVERFGRWVLGKWEGEEGGRGVWGVRTFACSESEDINTFIDVDDVGFHFIAYNYAEGDMRARAKLAYLSMYLEAAASQWWTFLSDDKKDTWEAAVGPLREKYGWRTELTRWVEGTS